MIARNFTQDGLGEDELCYCGSGRNKRQCCGRPGAPGPATSYLPEEVSRKLDELAALRHRLSADGFVALQGHRPATPAERRQSAARLSRQAVQLSNAGQFEQAAAALTAAVGITPDDAILHHNLGLVLARRGRLVEALAALRQAVTLQPKYAAAQCAMGGVLHGMGQVDAAIEAFRRATELDRKMVEAHLGLGQLLQSVLRLDEARESYRRGAAAGRNTPLGREASANLLDAEGSFAEAAQILGRLVARDPNNYRLTVLLALTLAALGEIEPALTQYRRAVTLAGDPAVAWTGIARLKKMTEADRPLVAQISAVLQHEQRPVQRKMLLFVLGKVLDDLGDHEAAIRHYDAANRIRRALEPFDRNHYAQRANETIARYTPQALAQRRGYGSDDETPLFVIGMPRSGTTLIAQVLSCHPQIRAAGELPFWRQRWREVWDAGAGAADASVVDRAAEDYLTVLRGVSATAARVIDKLPYNFLRVGEIVQAFPRARFIHSRRNPIDTCLSIYFTDFESPNGFVADRDDLVFFYRLYRRLMDHWRSVLPADRFIESDYETMVAEPEREARRLIEFCGLAWDPACLRPQDNRRVVQTASLWQARQPIYRHSLERWRRYEPWLGSLRELMPSQA